MKSTKETLFYITQGEIMLLAATQPLTKSSYFIKYFRLSLLYYLFICTLQLKQAAFNGIESHILFLIAALVFYYTIVVVVILQFPMSSFS